MGRANRFSLGQTPTDGSSNGFIDEMNLTRTNHAGFTHGAALDAGHGARDPHHQKRSDDPAPFIALGDKGFEHLLSGVKISDDAITQSPCRADVAWGSTQHQ